MNDRTEETKELLRHALTHREASPENDQLQDLFESLCSDLASCAAGPWRTDVKNAPKDGSEIWIEAKGGPEIFRAVAKWSVIYSFWAAGGAMLQDSDLRAFAIPNAPEVKP